ncbi:MAG TPA: RICIN domain-containing protein [Longimicrobium sp.]|nr:RICIN domain-containing protein [Longimicrobium sp.]
MSSIGRRAFARILLASGLVFTAACGNDLTTATEAPKAPRRTLTIDPNAYYVIRNVSSDKVMDVSDAGCCNGASLHQWEYEGLTNQQWRIVDLGNGYYKIVARHSGRVMDVQSASQYNGAKLHQWGYDGSTNQQWTINDAGNGAYYIQARHSGKVATVSNGYAYDYFLYDNGAGIRQYGYSGSWTQHWYIEEV